MSSVDERIVQMRFDNAQFESGVRQTLSSLDKLKQGLKFDAAINGANVLQNAFNGIKLNGINSSINQLNRKFSSLGIAGMEIVKRVTNDVLNSVTRVATAIPNQIKAGGWARALNLENAQFQLKGLGVAWDKINNDIQYAVNGTAYGLDSAAKVAGQLAASNIEVSDSALTATKSVDDFSAACIGQTSAALKGNGQLDEMATALRSISGVAAMSNSSFEEIGQIYTRVAGQGRVMAIDLNSIAARGLNAAATLGNYLGKTEAEVRDMVSKGQIDFKTFSDAMYDAYADQAVKANNTFQGALSNTKSALSRIGADVADDLLPALTKILNSCRLLFNQVHKWIQPVLDSTGKLVSQIGDTLSPIIDAITAKIAKITGIAGGPIEQIAGFIDKITAKVKGVGNDILSYFGLDPETAKKAEDVVKSVDSTVTASVEHITEMAKRVIHGDFGNEPVRSQNLEAIGENFEIIQNKVNELLGCSYRYKVQTDETTSSVNEQADAIKQTTLSIEDQQKIMRRNTVMNFFKGFENIGKTISLVFTSLGSSIKSFFSTLTPPDWSKFSSDFAKATGVIVNNTDRIKEVKQVIDDIVFSIGNTIEAVFQVIGTLGKAIVDVISKIKFKPPTEFTSVIRKITDNLKLSKDSGDGLYDIFTTLLSPLKLILPLIQDVNLFILKIVEGATSLNKKFLEFVGKSKILKSVQKIFESIGDVIKKIFDGVKNSEGFKKLTDAFGKFKDIFGEKVLNGLDDFAGKLASLSDIDIQSGSGLDRVINFFSGAAEQLSKVFDTMSDLMSGKINFGDIFAKLGEGLVGGISTAIGSIPVAGKLLGGFGKKLFGSFKKGGFKKQIAEGSTSMLGGLSDTIKSSFEEEINKSGGIKSQITNYAQTVGDTLTGFGTTVKEKFQSVNWKDIGSNIKENVGKVFDGIGSFILDPKTHKTILTLISIAKDIASIFTLVNAGKMFKSFSGIAGSISGFFGQLKTSVKEITDLYKMKAKIGMFKDIGKALLMIVGAMAAVSLIEKYGDLETSLEVVGGIIAALSALFITVGKIKLDIAQISAFGRACSGIGFAILAIVGSLAIVAHMNADMYREGLNRLIGLLGVYSVAMGLMFRIAGSGGAGIKTGAILTFAIAVNLLIIPLKVLAHMDADAYKDGLMKLIGLLGTLSIAMGAMARIAGDGTFAGLGTFIGVSVAILAITNALKSLSVLDTGTLYRNATALSEVFLAIGASFKLASEIKISGIVGFVVAITAVTGALMLLQNGPHPEELLPIATGLGLVFIALGASFKLMEDIKPGNAIGAAVAMALALAAATGALMVLQNGSNPKAVIPIAVGLGIALLAAGASLKILDGMKFGNTIGAAVAMGVALMAAAGALAILNNVPNPEAVLPIAEGLSVALIAVAAALRIMGGMGADIAGAVSAGASIGLAIDTIALCIEGFVALNGVFAKIPGFEKTITDGLRIIKKIMVGLGDAFGSAAGAFIGGFTKESSSRISDSMDAIQNIVTSMENMADSLSGTDFGSVLTNVRNLKKTIKELGKISIPDKFANKDKVSDMQDQFKSLTNLVHYIADNLSDIDEDTTSKIETLTDFIDNLTSFAKIASSNSFKNANNISSNMDELSSGLDSIKTFCTKLGKIELSEDDITKVENISKIIKTLSSSAVSGVGEGSFMGLKGLITGVGTFSGTASDIAGGVNDLNYFFSTLSGIRISDSVVDKVTNLSKVMTQLESSTAVGIGEGSFMGLKGLITGIGTFSGTASDIAGGVNQLNYFFSTLRGITIDDTVVDKVTKLSSIMTQLESSTAVGIGEGTFIGLKQLITGIGSFSGTASDIAGGVNNLNYFFSTLSGITIDDTVVDKVTKLSSMMTEMESATTTGVGGDWPGLKAFFTGVSSFSGTTEDLLGGVGNIVAFTRVIESVTVSDNAVSNVEQIAKMMDTLNSVDIQETGGLKQFFTGVKDFSKYAEDLSEFSSKFQEFSNNISSMSGLETAYTNMQTIADILKYFSSKSGLFSAEAYANVTSIVDGEMFSGGGPLMKFIKSLSDQVIPALNDIKQVDTSNFESVMSALMKFIKSLSDQVIPALNDIKQVDTSNFESVMSALKKVASMSADIQGLKDAGFDSISRGIKILASALTDDISGIDTGSVDSFVSSIQKLGTIDTSGLSTITDSLNDFVTNGIDKFKSGIQNANVTSDINSFIGKIKSGFSANAFDSAISSVDSFVSSIQKLGTIDTSGLSTITDSLNDFVTNGIDKFKSGIQNANVTSDINSFIGKIKSGFSANAFDSAISSADSFASSIQKLGTIDTSGLSTIADSLNDFVTNGIDKFKSGIQNANVTSDINSFIGKIKSGFSANAFDSAISSVDSAGKNIGSKFADALGSTKSTAKTKGAELGKAAIKGIKSVVGQAGPAGTSFGQKFATALQSSAGIARSAGLAVGQNASNGLNNASSYAYTSGVHFAQNFANGIHAGANAAISEAESIASKVHEILGHTKPKKGPMKDDDVWGKHFAENFATGIDEGSGTVVESASNMANSVWDVVSKLNAQGKKSVDDLAKSVSSTATKYLTKAKKTRNVTYKEVLLYWDNLLDKAKQNSAALLEENGNVNDVIYKSAEQFISDHKEQIDEYVTDEESLWKKVISLTEEGSDARQNAIQKYNDALVSDPENYISKMIKEYGEENVNQTETWVKALKTASEDSENVFDTTKQKIKENLNSAIIKDADNNVTNYTKDLGWMAYETSAYYDEAIKKAKELGATEATLNSLREKAGDAELSDIKTYMAYMKARGKSEQEIYKWLQLRATSINPENFNQKQWDSFNNDIYSSQRETAMNEIESFAEEDLSRMQTYYNMSNTQQALYWKAMLSKVEEGTSAYSKIEEKFFSARNAAWNEYTNAVQSTISSLQSQLSLSSEFKFEEPKFDIFENQRNIESGLEEYTSAMDELESRSVLTAENLKKIRETFGVKDLGMINQLLNMSDGSLSSFNDSMTRTNELVKSYAENVNQNLKPTFLYTDDEITEISESAVRVMQAISDVAGDKQWVESVSASMKNIAGTSAKRTSDEKTKDYVTLGHNLMDGTIRGITERSPILASAVASAVARAIEAARAAAQVHSPSKKMMKIGSFMGEGLIIGMKDWVHSAGAMGKNLGNTALSGMDYMMAALASDISDNMDMQPVIRPVIDMSDVTSSANAIDSMLSSEQAMRVAAGYDSLMASRQNGSVGSVTNDNSVGSINVNIYPTENQNANDISDAVIKKLNNEIIRKRKVYA